MTKTEKRKTHSLIGILQRHPHYVVAILLAIAVILTYSNHFNNTFHFDDTHTINENIYIRSLKNIPQIFTDIKTFGSMPDNRGYRPIVTASTAIDYWLGGGLYPFYFHLSQFIIFLLQGVFMFFLFLKISTISDKHDWNYYFAFAATGWYLLHPGNAETINYIIARSDSYSTFFVVAGLALYAYSKTCRKWLLYMIPVALGILSKITAVMFPLFLFAYIFLFEERVAIREVFSTSGLIRLWNAVKKTLPAFILSLAVGLLVNIKEHQPYVGFPSPEGLGRHYWYVLTQPYVLFTYFTQFFLPISLSSDPDLDIFSTYADPRMYVGFLFLLVMVYLIYRTSNNSKYRPICFGFLWFFIASIPTSLIGSLSQVSNSHRLFYPYVGLALGICWFIYLFILKIKPVFNEYAFKKGLIIIILLVLTGYAIATVERNKVWRTEESLWKDIISKSPENPRAAMNYGLSFMGRGEYDEALFYFKQTYKKWPYWQYILINMAILYNAMNRPLEAEQYYKQAVTYHGETSGDVNFYYGKFLYDLNRIPEAIDYLNKAITVSETYLTARIYLMQIYQQQKQWESLKALAQRTLEIAPNNSEAQFYLRAAQGQQSEVDMEEERINQNPTPEAYLELSMKYYQRGLYEECVAACTKAIKLRPNYVEALNNLCAAYNNLKKWDQAIIACEKALALDPQFALARNNLLWAQGERNKIK